jgi:nucleoside-diphosphate-sugar epimerase
MRVMITGGAGYIGCVLTQALLCRGHEVTILDRLVFGLPKLAPHEGLALFRGDIRDTDAIRSIVRGHDAVVHLAFASNDPEYRLDRNVAYQINIAPLPSLLVTSRELGVRRFIFLSSCSVYGLSNVERVDESIPPAPLTDYAHHKLACEEIVARHCSSSMVGVSLRAATVCGPSPRQRFDLLLNRMLAQAFCYDAIRAPARSRARPILPMRELVSVVCWLLTCSIGTAPYHLFNVAFENREVHDWARLAQRLTGNCARLEFFPYDGDQRSYSVISERLSIQTGYKPTTIVEEDALYLANELKSRKYPDPLNDLRWINLKAQLMHDFTKAVATERVL